MTHKLNAIAIFRIQKPQSNRISEYESKKFIETIISTKTKAARDQNLSHRGGKNV